MIENVFDQIAPFYDYEFGDKKDDIPFFLEHAQKAKGPALELACGTGRILIPIAQTGIPITGLDISQDMLDICRKKLKQCSPETRKNVSLAHGDMKAFNLNTAFDLIYIPFNSFQCLLSKGEQGQCLQSVRSHLSDKGIFILSIFAPKHEYLAHPRRCFYMGSFEEVVKGVTVYRRAETRHNYVDQIIHNDFFYEWTDKKGKFHRKVWSFDVSYLFRYEAELLLEKHGFMIDRLYGNFEKASYDYITGYQIFIAKKRV